MLHQKNSVRYSMQHPLMIKCLRPVCFFRCYFDSWVIRSFKLAKAVLNKLPSIQLPSTQYITFTLISLNTMSMTGIVANSRGLVLRSLPAQISWDSPLPGSAPLEDNFFQGLAKGLASSQFLLEVAIMYDSFSDLTKLSCVLQDWSNTSTKQTGQFVALFSTIATKKYRSPFLWVLLVFDRQYECLSIQ